MANKGRGFQRAFRRDLCANRVLDQSLRYLPEFGKIFIPLHCTFYPTIDDRWHEFTFRDLNRTDGKMIWRWSRMPEFGHTFTVTFTRYLSYGPALYEYHIELSLGGGVPYINDLTNYRYLDRDEQGCEPFGWLRNGFHENPNNFPCTFFPVLY